MLLEKGKKAPHASEGLFRFSQAETACSIVSSFPIFLK